MGNAIQIFIMVCFCVNSTMTANFAIRFANEKKPKLAINKLVMCVMAFSTIWSIGMGMMSIQTDDRIAYAWRVFGIFGTFGFMMSVQKILCVISELPKKVQIAFNGISYLGLFVFLIYIIPGQTIFVHNSIGTTFYFRDNWINIIYSVYYTVVSFNILLVTIYMLTRHRFRRTRAAGMRFILVELLIFTGAIFDMVMPSFGYPALPGSAITHFWGVCVFWFAIRDIYKSQMSFSNVSEFIYSSLDIPVLIFDSDNKLSVFNNASASFLRINHITFKEGVETIDNYFETDEDFFEFEDRSCLKRAKCLKNEAPCELSISKIKDQYGDVIGYILIINDLTQHELVVQKLEQAKLAADSANMSKSLFLANMSHEIRTPMNAILGFSDIALSENIDSKTREYLTEIKQSGVILLSIINEILDISKIELGKQELNCTDYKPARLFKDVEQITQVNANKKGIDFSVNIDPECPEELNGDKDKLREILINLLSNAVKYTNQGKVEFFANVLSREDDTVKIEFKVKDTGIGIKEEELPTVFEKFQRLDASYNSKTEGTGLGLSITKGLVELMGGQIIVESVYGEGSTFKAIISQKVISEKPITLIKDAPEEQTDIKALNYADAKVLVVDDNKINVKLATTLLKKLGIKSDAALSGKESIELCEENAYDIVFMDQMMPEMDGVEAMNRIRTIAGYEKGSKQKIIALTANIVEGVEEELLSLGFDGFLGKPIIFDVFKTTVNDVLKNREG